MLMDCLETTLHKYYIKTMESLFPKKIKPKNKFKIYMINFVHMIGTLYVFFGIFTPYKYLHLYLIYLITIILLYFILRDKCFMNEILDKNIKKKIQIKAGSNSLNCVDSKITHLKMKTIYFIILTLIIITIIGLISKDLSISNMIVELIKKLNEMSLGFHIIPLVTLYAWIIGYFVLIGRKST